MVKNSSSKFMIKNIKGFTLVEALVAIAIIGIVAVGMTSLIFSISRTSRMSEEQLRINALMTVVKENVIYSARSKTEIPGNTGVQAVIGVNRTGLTVVDMTGHEHKNYTFDLESQTPVSYGDPNKTVKVFKVIIRHSSEPVTEFYIEVYDQGNQP